MTSGFSVSGAIPRSSATCSGRSPPREAASPRRAPSVAASSASTSRPGFPRAFFVAFSSADSITRQVGQGAGPPGPPRAPTPAPRRGPKHRTTTARASASRSLATDWALDVPPGTSTNRTCAATVFADRSISVRTLEPRIGHRHDGDRRLPAVGSGVRQRREQGRLAARRSRRRVRCPSRFVHGSSGVLPTGGTDRSQRGQPDGPHEPTSDHWRDGLGDSRCSLRDRIRPGRRQTRPGRPAS